MLQHVDSMLHGLQSRHKQKAQLSQRNRATLQTIWKYCEVNDNDGFWATACKTVRSMLSDRCPACLSVCLSVLSVCNVGVLWPNVGRIEMTFGTQVGLGPGHIVLDGDPGPLPQRHSPQFSAHICCDQMAR